MSRGPREVELEERLLNRNEGGNERENRQPFGAKWLT